MACGHSMYHQCAIANIAIESGTVDPFRAAPVTTQAIARILRGYTVTAAVQTGRLLRQGFGSKSTGLAQRPPRARSLMLVMYGVRSTEHSQSNPLR